MWPLDDITIYYDGNKIEDTPDDWTFSKVRNYLSDFYHNSLNGYKPPKTGGICIHIEDQPTVREPNYFGAICQVYTSMDENLYLKLDRTDQYKYILDLIQAVIERTAKKLKWDLHVFDLNV